MEPASRLVWRAYWALAALGSLLAALAVLVSAFGTPGNQEDWSLALNHSASRFTRQCRSNYLILKCAVVSLACVLDALVLWLKWAEPTPPPYMPCAHVALQILRFIFASADLALACVFAESPFINPSYGMYGWSTSLGGFPGNLTFENRVHLALAVAAAGAYGLLGHRAAWNIEWRTARFARAILMVVSVWYPVYDSKHWFPASRLDNAWGAYFIFYAPLVAAVEVWREIRRSRSEAVPPEEPSPRLAVKARCLSIDCAIPAPYEQLIDWYQALLLSISAAFLLLQLSLVRLCWDWPDTYTKETVFSQAAALYRFGQVWKTVFVWVCDLGVSTALFLLVETLGCFRGHASSPGPGSGSGVSPRPVRDVPALDGEPRDGGMGAELSYCTFPRKGTSAGS
uniref:Uncharacterized protein n=1 Tax=Zooxanthella nutricula TaxID=1333877 RepID=A0A7S2PTN0_9DINO